MCYAGSVELFGLHLPRFGIQVSLVDTSDPEQVQAALRPNTRLIYAETPANPILRMADIPAWLTSPMLPGPAGGRLRPGPARPCSNPSTGGGFRHPQPDQVHQRPRRRPRRGGPGQAKEIQRIRREMLVHLGGAMSPFNAWLILRGLVTLPLRMQQHCESALQVAQFLESHPKVNRVIYPGLDSHPQHELAQRQMALGGMLTFQLKGGLGAAISLSEKIRLFSYATSLGHAHSLLFYYPTDLYVDAGALPERGTEGRHPRVDGRRHHPRQHRPGKRRRPDRRPRPGTAWPHLRGRPVRWLTGIMRRKD